MKKSRERLYCPVFDLMKVPGVLNRIADEHRDKGYRVCRGALGSVILQFPDGEVHLVPDQYGIQEIVFQFEAGEVTAV